VTVDEAMTQKLIPAVRLQIARGGVRLAKLLNETLG
jgi:hypoxanthine phosphoribosyltransferase